jgi:site-specific DNA recombinase
MGQTCVIYTRVSSFDGINCPSTDRQERLTRKYCESRDWRVVEVFTDVDRSAYTPGVLREGFERLIERIATRSVDVVAVWRLDRLVRRPAEFERIWLHLEQANVSLVSATEPVDSTSPIGLAIVRMLVTFSGLESTAKSERLRAKQRELAEAGAPHVVVRPFGHTKDLSAVVEPEADLLREAADRIIAGESTWQITRDWEQRGVAGRTGKPWSGRGLSSTLRSARLTGDRSHHGEVTARDCFAPILDRSTALQVRAVLRLRIGKRDSVGSLLRGRIRCGRCGAVMYSGDIPRGRTYTCHMQRGCGRISVKGEHLDRWVTEQVLWRIKKRNPANGRRLSWRGHEAELEAAINAADDELTRLNQAFFVHADISRGEYIALRDELLARSGVRIRNMGPGWPPPELPPTIGPRDLTRVWDTLSMPTKRAVIACQLERIIIHPAPGRGGFFHPGRLEPIWHPDLAHIDPPPQRPAVRGAPHPPWRPTDDDGNPMLVLTEVRAITGLSNGQIDRATRTGALPFTRIKRRRWFARSVVEQFDYRTTLLPRRQAPQPRAAAGELSATEATRYLHVQYAKLSRLVDHGLINATRVGRRTWFMRADLDDYIERCRIATGDLPDGTVETRRARGDPEHRARIIRSGTVHLVPSSDIWLSTQDAAARLGITTRTLYRLVDHGELPAYRMGRVIRLKADDVDAFIEASRIEPGALKHLYPGPADQDE